MSPGVVEVVWDGSRVYRVPHENEVRAIQLLSEGMNTQRASLAMGLASATGAKRRANAAMSKLGCTSAAGALYQLYRLGLADYDVDDRLQPVLTRRQLEVLDTVSTLGLPYGAAAQHLDMGRNTLGRHVQDIYRALGAVNLTQAVRKAVERGDIRVRLPRELWRGTV